MTFITVNRKLSVESLLDIKDPEFARQYSMGVWWAMYGDEQGKGIYPDSYLIENIERNIRAGRYDHPQSDWFSSVGFYLGMVHGGCLNSNPTDFGRITSLVILTVPDFVSGYHVGLDYFFNEAPLEGRHLSDRLLIETINNWALEYQTWREPRATLAYCLGCRIGELSGNLTAVLINTMLPVTAL